MSTFTIRGNKIFHKFWTKINNISQKRVRRYQDNIVDITAVSLPTPFTMVIKFTITNTGNKFELLQQGQFQGLFRKVQDGETIVPEEHGIEHIIRSEFKYAYKVN